MQLSGVFLLLGLLPLERSEAYGSSQTAGSGHIDLGSWDLGAQSLAELSHYGGHPSAQQQNMWVEVRASSANAPVPGGEAVNELTVAVRTREPIWKIRLSLPERQLCPDPKVCLGYRFHEAKGAPQQCDIVDWNYKKLKLPESKLQVVDIQKQGLIDSCRVDNTFGDGGLGMKRSEMMLVIRQDVVADLVVNSWLIFKIKVLNPPETPVDRPGSSQKANTWQVELESGGGLLGMQTLPAPQILSLWMCSYTDWMWTTPCTARCGGGVRYSVRRLLHPPPFSYPRELLIGCNEALSQTHPCNEDPCAVDCKLGDWTPFADGPCSVTCGQGFQVERRRVVEGPVGKGKLCPPHDKMNVRVRYKECKAKDECKPRCDLAPKTVLYGQCSDVCRNSGLRVTERKEEGKRYSVRVIGQKAKEATLESCGAAYEKVPCGITCDALNFLPAQAGRLPRIGKWTEMVIIFFLDDLAQGIKIDAPKGFDIGKTESTDGNDSLCLLKSHNIPRLKRCTTTTKDGSTTATFELLNAIEGIFVTKSGAIRQQKYEVVFWIKSPDECPGGFDEHGACKVPHGTWDWKLRTWSQENGRSTVEEEAATFKVYNEQAKDWVPASLTASNNEEDQVHKQDFLLGVEDKKKQDALTGKWVYVLDHD